MVYYLVEYDGMSCCYGGMICEFGIEIYIFFLYFITRSMRFLCNVKGRSITLRRTNIAMLFRSPLILHLQDVKKVRRHLSNVPCVLKKVMFFTELRCSKIEGRCLFHIKLNVEMDHPPQCRGRLNAKKWFSPMLVSVRTVMPNTSRTTLNTICAWIARNIFKLFSLIMSYYFNLLKLSLSITLVLSKRKHI